MACAACQQRRQIIAQAAQQGGAVGVIKSIPTVASHLVNDIRAKTVRYGKRK